MNTEAVWNDFADGLHRYIRARVPSDADADDVLQDVFVKVLSREHQLREQERLAGWIFRIASNAVTDLHRQAQRPGVHLAEPADEMPVSEELATCVLPFIDALDEPYRSALRMTEIEGLTQIEAAERAGISISGMKSRVQRGRVKLRALFDSCCEIQLDARNRIVSYEPRCEGNC